MPPKSSISPQRRAGMRGITAPANLSLPTDFSVISVTIQPGRMLLTRILWRASSTASARTKTVTAPLLAP
jgi:hypothetical protein